MIVFATTLLRGVMMTDGPRKKRGRPPNPIPSVEIVRELTEADLQLLEARDIERTGVSPVDLRLSPRSLCRLSQLMAKAQTASGLTERNVALLRPIARFMWPLPA